MRKTLYNASLLVSRRETIRVLGLLGALDTFKHKMYLGQVDTRMNSTALLSMSDGKYDSEISHGKQKNN